MLWETFVFRLVLCKGCVGVKATAIQTLTPRAPCRELYLGGPALIIELTNLGCQQHGSTRRYAQPSHSPPNPGALRHETSNAVSPTLVIAPPLNEEQRQQQEEEVEEVEVEEEEEGSQGYRQELFCEENN
ncbi:unnamed protein product [Gadus morhua 'NCC']